MKLLLSMLRRLLPVLSFLLLLFSGVIVFADETTDMTSPYFRVDTCSMDPMHPNCSTWGVSGKEAFLFLLGKFSTILLYMVPIIAGISFMVAAYYYILSAGDTEKVSQAKTIIKWNIVAILVAFFSLTIVKIVQYIIS